VTVFLFSLFVFYSTLSAGKSQSDGLTRNEYTVLKICEGIIQLFKQSPDSVWPGYNLSQRPFVVYLPGKWALFFNYSQNIDGFSEYPKNWPNLGCKVLYHQGQYKDLVGQLAFDFQVDTLKTVAIGFPEENLDSLPHAEVLLFGNYIHEAFHQYQSEAFGETLWEREERYPILDRENTALAFIEMKFLMDALEMMKSNNEVKCRDYVEKFVAIRNYRWQHGNPFIARYEQGQEIHEGTPRYVEMKSIALMKSLKYQSALSGLTSSLQQDFESISFPDFLIADLQERMTENSIRPEDMLRNRIYPVGSAIGFLLDYFHVDWKTKAQQAGYDFTFAQMFTDGLGLQKNQLNKLVDDAKNMYNYDLILSSTDKIIEEYQVGFNKELTSFEAQFGYRIQIDFTTKSLSRSRASLAKKWLVNKGTLSICSRYQVYTLKNDKMQLQIQNSGVFEQNDWDERKYTVVFFTPEIANISTDGQNISLTKDGNNKFQKLELSGSNCKFSYSKKGTVVINQKQIKITLDP
jgi:hypothetical protein